MSKTEFQILDTIHPKNIYPPINITPVLWHRGDFCGTMNAREESKPEPWRISGGQAAY